MSSNKNIVKLDIGGTVFKTSKSTLTKFDGFFKSMLEIDIPVIKDSSDAIFIDRSPKHFDLILNYMRDGDVELPESSRKVREIQKEAQYYLLTGLVELCQGAVPVVNSSEIIVNVGGTIFHTTKATFKSWYIYRFNSIPTVSQPYNIFIDRDPKHFRLILNYMRDDYVHLPETKIELREIGQEAEYYRLDGLAYFCEDEIRRLNV